MLRFAEHSSVRQRSTTKNAGDSEFLCRDYTQKLHLVNGDSVDVGVVHKPDDLIAEQLPVVLTAQVGLRRLGRVELQALADALPQHIQRRVGLRDRWVVEGGGDVDTTGRRKGGLGRSVQIYSLASGVNFLTPFILCFTPMQVPPACTMRLARLWTLLS